jgi:hypothetical protein
MKKNLVMGIFVLFFVFGVQSSSEAKTKSLQEVEGDRVVVLKIDKKAKLPKKFLKRNEATAYIGSMDDLQKKVTGNLYTGENVIRHEKSPRVLNLSDGIIFNTDGGKIGYVSRKDGAYTIILDYPEGRKLETVDEALFDKYSNVINDDCTVPYVFFDKDGNEAAIAYLPKSMLVYQYITIDGSVAIEVFEQI